MIRAVYISLSLIARQRGVGNVEPEELAQRLPAVRRLPDEQFFGRDGALDLFVVAVEGGLEIESVTIAGVEHVRLDPHLGHQLEVLGPLGVEITGGRDVEGQRVADQTVDDRLVHAPRPAFRRPHAEHYLGLGIELHKVLVVEARGPVDARLEVLERLLEVSVAFEDCAPSLGLIEIAEDVNHVEQAPSPSISRAIFWVRVAVRVSPRR